MQGEYITPRTTYSSQRVNMSLLADEFPDWHNHITVWNAFGRAITRNGVTFWRGYVEGAGNIYRVRSMSRGLDTPPLHWQIETAIGALDTYPAFYLPSGLYPMEEAAYRDVGRLLIGRGFWDGVGTLKIIGHPMELAYHLDHGLRLDALQYVYQERSLTIRLPDPMPVDPVKWEYVGCADARQFYQHLRSIMPFKFSLNYGFKVARLYGYETRFVAGQYIGMGTADGTALAIAGDREGRDADSVFQLTLQHHKHLQTFVKGAGGLHFYYAAAQQLVRLVHTHQGESRWLHIPLISAGNGHPSLDKYWEIIPEQLLATCTVKSGRKLVDATAEIKAAYRAKKNDSMTVSLNMGEDQLHIASVYLEPEMDVTLDVEGAGDSDDSVGVNLRVLQQAFPAFKEFELGWGEMPGYFTPNQWQKRRIRLVTLQTPELIVVIAETKIKDW